MKIIELRIRKKWMNIRSRKGRQRGRRRENGIEKAGKGEGDDTERHINN